MSNLYILNEIITNSLNYNLLNFVSILAIISGISVTISKNPIVSVLFLIGFLSILYSVFIINVLNFYIVFIARKLYNLAYVVLVYILVCINTLYELLQWGFRIVNFIVYIVFSEVNIDFSLKNNIKLIMTSVIVKSIIYLMPSSLSFVVSILIATLILFSFFISDNKSQFIWNINVILLFWSIIGVFPVFLVNDALLCEFLLSYQNTLCFDGAISPDLQATLDSVFENLDNTLSGFFNGGPGGPNETPSSLFFIPSSDDSDDHEKMYNKFWKNLIDVYYSKSFWDLGGKYHDLITFGDYINKYNNSVEYENSHLATIKVTEMLHSDMFSEYLSWTDYDKFYTPIGDIHNYNDMVAKHKMCLWENDFMSKARLYWEFKYMDRPLPSNYSQLQYESAYNFWINKNSNIHIFSTLELKYSILPKSAPDMIYRELCSDNLWIKLNLVIIKSFLSHKSPFIYKMAKFNSIMPEVIASHLIEFDTAYTCQWDLNKMLYSKYSKTLLTDAHKTSPIKVIFPKIQSSVFNQIGFKCAHKFAYPEFSGKVTILKLFYL